MTSNLPVQLAEISKLSARSAPEWNHLFNRKSGWTGADGIYSIPLSGKESHSNKQNEKTILLFSDTFISEVDEQNRRHNCTMINNSYAVMEGFDPSPEKITFNWPSNDKKQPDSVFIADSSYAQRGDWLWLMDGICIEKKIYIFALRLKENPAHIFNFKIMGVSLITTELNSDEQFKNYKQIETPLFFKGQNELQDIVFGQAIMPLTEESGNPGPNGYVYIYGPRGSLIEKELLVARVRPENFSNVGKWRFWDGTNWASKIEKCRSLTTGISQEFSISPLPDGKFILVFQKEKKVGIRLAESPVGPFSEIQYIWDCHEADNDPDIYIYNAKAHPHLSKPGELLISYNVNCHTLKRHDIEADLYRPRFISLKLPLGVCD